MTTGLRLLSLSFHGPSRPAATINFGSGLNVIFGASEAGKSFIIDAIDFMLGGRPPLRDVPERIGYDQILLAIGSGDEQFTIARSVEGGAFRLYDGAHADQLPTTEPKTLGEVHNDRKDDNLSAFLLSKLGIEHKRIRKNKANETQNLSFRNLARLAIVNEQEIIQQRSPLSDGNVVADTPNTSTFKFLLTGVDDSSLTSSLSKSPEDQNRFAQLGLLDQLIGGYKKQIKDLAGKPGELEEQLDRLEASMDERSEQLSFTEVEFKGQAATRRDLAKKIEEGRNRLAEVTALLDRFDLLAAHYRSDVDRLRGIEEAGSLFDALARTSCPLCGAGPEHQHARDVECAGDVDKIISAARSEIKKINIRELELRETVATLRKEAAGFERRLPGLEERFSAVSHEIERVIAPNLKQLRSTYKELADKGGEVREALAIYRGLQDLEDRKAGLEAEAGVTPGSDTNSDVSLSTAVTDKFATLILEILQAWHFPHIQRVHFEAKDRDLVINGKRRTSYGKGLRAITQSAFTIGLLDFCRRNDTPHPGFVVLDSPLLSYKEPDGDEDDLRGTDLKPRFYDYLVALDPDCQVIIIENTDPPEAIQKLPQSLKFTGNSGLGRGGLFPAEEGSDPI